MKLVVDASAVLAVCKQEAGMVVAREKMRGGLICAVNLSEVYCIAIKSNRRALAEAVVQTAELEVIAFDRNLASLTASLEEATRKQGVSFADRACIALGLHENRPILTGDHKWATLDLNVKLDFFRPESS